MDIKPCLPALLHYSREFSMTNTISTKSRLPVVVLLMAVSLGLYANTLTNAFVWDDLLSVAESRHVRDIGNIPRFFSPRYWNESHPYPGQYRPVRMISFTLDYFFSKLNPAGYRVTNVLLHAANVLLVFYLVILAVESGSGGDPFGRRRCLEGTAFLTALLFAAHPIHTESVNLIKNRSDLLVMVFCLISLLLFIRHLSAAGRIRSWLMLAGAWFCFIPAVLSKEMALSLPGVAALYAACFLSGDRRKKALIRVIPYGMIILGYFWFMHAFIRPGDPLPPVAVLPAGAIQRVMTVIKTLGIYFRMLLFPFPLVLEHPFSIPETLLDPGILTFLLLLAPTGILAARSLFGNRIVLFAIGWIWLTLVPAANIVYVAARPIAEQRLYIPSLGFCLMLGYGLQSLASPRSGRSARSLAVLIGGIIFILYAAVAVQRNREWRDEITLYTRSLAENAASPRIQYNLGNALCREQRYEEAVGHYRAALRLVPDYLDAHYNLGITLYGLGKHEEAIGHYRQVLAREPGNVDALNNLGVALHASARLDEALGVFTAALKISPGDMQANWNMGDLLVDLGRSREAVGYYTSALKSRPDCLAVYHSLGKALMEQGETDKAIAVYEKAFRIYPDDADILCNFGVALMVQGKRPEEACALLSRALRIDPCHVKARQAYQECPERIN
ncbi:MAG: tetratricopeptide repeat protein [Thermodesulfobacteriota bacterium]